MARYIDADKLFRYVDEQTHLSKGKLQNYIRENNTSDVEEVKHGEWYLIDECSNEGVYCSVCHKKVYKMCYGNVKVKSKYCPNCGAKMKGKEKEV